MSGSRFRQSGISIVELMIAMTLGLVLVAGATQIFMANTQAFRLQSNISSAQETGRLGIEMLITDLRRAGVDEPESILALASRSFGVTGKNASATTAAVAGLLTDSDEVTISYRVPPEVATMSDCEGHIANSTAVIVNRYFVKLDTNPSVPALFCEGTVDGIPAVASGGTALIRGVESFQVQYGLASGYGKTAGKGNGFTSPVRYILGGNGTLQDFDGVAGINENDALQVASIRVALLVRSEAGVQGVKAPANAITVLDTTVAKATLDGLKVGGAYPVHRYFIGTAALRNLAYGYF